MSFKSENQRKFMNAAAARGDIKQNIVDEYNKASKGKKLPMKVRKSDGGMIDENDSKDHEKYKALKKMMGIK